jgi:hypothetical protein
MVRGPLSRFAVIVLMVVLVSLGAGLLIRLLAPGFESTEDAVWWAFLRLTDPGYLGDDEGAAKRTVSTVITVLGYLLFTGSLIAILTQWLVETMQRLELGLTPVALKEHIVVLGWTSRTPTTLEEIMASQGRVRRFLRRRGARRLRLALLAEQADATLMQEVRDRLGKHWNSSQIILRNGSPLRLDHLERVDFAHAAAILIPAADALTTGPIHADARTVKALMTLGAALDQQPGGDLPIVVAEMQDVRLCSRMRSVYRGPLEIIAGDQVISRLIAQNVRHPGLSHVYAELLSDGAGSQVYVREASHLVGESVQHVAASFAEAVLLGVARPDAASYRAMLNPPDDLRLEVGDRVVLLARSYDDAAPPETVSSVEALEQRPAPRVTTPGLRRVLVLGWSHRVPNLLGEFASYAHEQFAIDVVSQVAAAKREAVIEAHEASTERLQLRQLELDYAVPAHLESLDPGGYDNVVLLASERLKPGAESDARTILGYLLLRDLMPAGGPAPQVLVELTDPDNVPLLENRAGEVIISPVIISHMLARVALRRELRAVFDELFSSGGSEISFRLFPDYGIATGAYRFADLQRAADARGEIAIGVRRAEEALGGGVQLNPPRQKRLQLFGEDELIVLTTYQ